MGQTPLYQAMKEAVNQTLENMAFMEVMEHFDQTLEIPPEQLAWCSLLINDPVQGEIRLAMTNRLLRKLTSAIFAIDDDEVQQAQMNDILHELLNTIAGLFMTNLLPDNQTFRLGLPEAGEGELPGLEEDAIAWKLMTPDEDPLQIFAVGAPLLALHDTH